MDLALCNEVIRDMDFAEQCVFAASLGYQGLEVAPFTLTGTPQSLTAGELAALRRSAEEAGVRITGLHWLLVAPEGLSITSPDPGVRQRTRDFLLRLIDICAELGGSVLVHGSPAQRQIAPGEDWPVAYQRAKAIFADLAERAAAAGVTYCIEPLSEAETAFINRVEEAARLVDEIDSPAFRTMIDTSAAARTEQEPVADLIRKWMPRGKLAHIQFNDRNRRGPGQGQDDFAPVLQALRDTGYQGVVAMEPFIYEPDGPATAARCIEYVKQLMEQLA